MAARIAVPGHFNTVSGSGRACQGQQEHCVNTPNPDTVLNTASESAGCYFGAAKQAEPCNGCAPHGFQTTPRHATPRHAEVFVFVYLNSVKRRNLTAGTRIFDLQCS